MADKCITIKKDGKIISFNEETLKENINWCLLATDRAIADFGNIEPKGTKKKDVIAAFDDVKKTIDNILSGKIDIFDCIPLTKSGTWNKNKSYLVKSYGIKLVDVDGSHVNKHILQLRLVPIPCESKYTVQSGDGCTLYLEAQFFTHADEKEPPIIGDDGTLHKVVVKASNKYLKQDAIIEWHDYEDAKGNKYRYLGTTRGEDSLTLYRYCRLTKKALKVLPECKTAEELMDAGVIVKEVHNPLKFLREAES